MEIKEKLENLYKELGKQKFIPCSSERSYDHGFNDGITLARKMLKKIMNKKLINHGI